MGNDVTAARPLWKPFRGMEANAGPRRGGTFEEFYRHHAGTVQQALSLALGDPDLGAEAAAEALTRACERWDQVRGYDNVTGWVYTVGLNWGISRHRRNRWRDRRAVPDRHVLPVPGDTDLAAALARLTAEHRAVVVCRYYLDWSVEQTATALGLRSGTVKSRLARALGSLQRHLEPEGRP